MLDNLAILNMNRNLPLVKSYFKIDKLLQVYSANYVKQEQFVLDLKEK